MNIAIHKLIKMTKKNVIWILQDRNNKRHEEKLSILMMKYETNDFDDFLQR